MLLKNNDTIRIETSGENISKMKEIFNTMKRYAERKDRNSIRLQDNFIKKS